MTVMRLQHVQIGCPRDGEAAARSFYAGLLGLTEVPKPAALAGRGGLWFRGAGYELHIGVEEPFVPAKRAHPAFVVDNLDPLATTLVAAGVEVTPDVDLLGYRRVHARDPHGNRVELMAELPS